MKTGKLIGKTTALLLLATLISPLLLGADYANAPGQTGAEDGILYVSVAPPEVTTDEAAESSWIETAAGVTQEMCTAGYWNDRNEASGIAADELLISEEEIRQLNAEMLEAPDAYMNALTELGTTYNADERRKALAAAITTPAKNTICVNQVELTDKDAYFKRLSDAVLATGYTEETRENQYAVAIRRTPIRDIPTTDYIGWSATDSDDEKVISALNVNEPFVVRQRAVVDGKTFYWGYSNIVTGWVCGDDLALCADREEWLDAFQVDPGKRDFIVVTQNQIRLEPSVPSPELSEVKLTFATILKLVPAAERPAKIGERGPWNNYVVYLPTRNAEGRYEKRMALISQHYEVSVGFSALTQDKLLKIAFNNLGDRYGWGGMLDSMDCSLFTRNVYRCFGMEIPRNTTWQQAIPGRKIDLTGKSDEEKLSALRRMPAGTLLYFSGHTMIYIGMAPYTEQTSEQKTETGAELTEEQKPEGEPEQVPAEMAYVISDTGSLSDSTGEVSVRTMYSIVLNPLTVRRRSGNTWLREITAAVLPISAQNMELVKKNIENPEPAPEPEPEPEPELKRVPAGEGQTYASSGDTLPLESFLGTTQNMFISFYLVDDADVDALTVTAVKGTKLTTKVPVDRVECDKDVASVRIGKANGLATLTLTKSGPVTFFLRDGKSYRVTFTVETPKPQSRAVKELIRESAAEGASGTVTLDVAALFGTRLDNGTLTIVRQKTANSTQEGNVLTLNTREKNSIRLSYTWLEKKYTMNISY